MDRRIEALHDWGCNTTEALERMLDDEEFYMECLYTVVENPNFEILKKALTEKNAEKAFESAHALKGILGNVGVTPMYELIVEIVEPLRNGHWENLMEKFTTLAEMKAHLEDIIKN